VREIRKDPELFLHIGLFAIEDGLANPLESLDWVAASRTSWCHGASWGCKHIVEPDHLTAAYVPSQVGGKLIVVRSPQASWT
jgi:hypothetical protein